MDIVMTTTNPVLNFFNRSFGAKLTPQQEEFVLIAYRKENFKKREIIFRPGDSNTRHYILEKGLVRLYLIDPKGKEINILFARENQVIGDLSTPEPTNFYLETIEESIVYSIEEGGLNRIMNHLDIGGSFDPNNGLRRSYIYIQKRLVSILSKSAEENYLEFQRKHHDLMQRLPQYQIAAFLGISPEFLSKIIAKTSKKK
jgi:CRP-like cAMP-binding protein